MISSSWFAVKVFNLDVFERNWQFGMTLRGTERRSTSGPPHDFFYSHTFAHFYSNFLNVFIATVSLHKFDSLFHSTHQICKCSLKHFHVFSYKSAYLVNVTIFSLRYVQIYISLNSLMDYSFRNKTVLMKFRVLSSPSCTAVCKSSSKFLLVLFYVTHTGKISLP